MKRKLLSAVLSMAMAASLMVGCGSAAPAQTQTDNSAAQTETKTETKNNLWRRTTTAFFLTQKKRYATNISRCKSI